MSSVILYSTHNTTMKNLFKELEEYAIEQIKELVEEHRKIADTLEEYEWEDMNTIIQLYWRMETIEWKIDSIQKEFPSIDINKYINQLEFEFVK